MARWLHPDAESPALCRFGEILATRSATKREVVRVELIAMLHAGERRFDVLSDCPTFLKGGVRSWN